MVETPTILKQDLLTSISQVAQNIPCCFRNALTGFFFFTFIIKKQSTKYLHVISTKIHPKVHKALEFQGKH